MRNVGTSLDVVRAFVDAGTNRGGPEGPDGLPYPNRTGIARVPGGTRVSVELEPDGTLSLYSYRTIVAIKLLDGAFALTPRKYGPSTGKLLGRIRSAIAARYWTVDGGTVPVTVQVPGRHGGYGIPWHSTGYESLPFILYT